MKDIKINSLVELLEYSNKDKYKEILNKYSKHKTILQNGLTLGEVSTDIEAVSELTIESLSVSNATIIEITRALQKRIDKSRLIELIGSLIGVLSSAGLITALLVDNTKITIITASINLLASVSVILSTYIEKSLYGNKSTLNDYIQKAIKLSLESNQTLSELQLLLKLQGDKEKIIELIKKANYISAEINVMRIHIGL